METRLKLTRIPRTVGFCHSLRHEVEDLEDAWDFVKKEELESEDEDDDNTPEREFKDLKAEDLGKANNALQAHKLIVAEIKKKIEHELYMAEAAATGGWGAVAVLENQKFTNVSGTNEEKEMKTQKIRKVMDTFAKEQRHNKAPSYGPLQRKKRQGLASRRKFASGPYAEEWKSGYGGYGATDGQEGFDGYRQGYDLVGNRRGRGSGGYRGDGGPRRGNRAYRTCHRCKSTCHLVATCPVPAPEADK